MRQPGRSRDVLSPWSADLCAHSRTRLDSRLYSEPVWELPDADLAGEAAWLSTVLSRGNCRYERIVLPLTGTIFQRFDI